MRNEMFSKNAAMLGGAAKQKAPIYDRGFAWCPGEDSNLHSVATTRT